MAPTTSPPPPSTTTTITSTSTSTSTSTTAPAPTTRRRGQGPLELVDGAYTIRWGRLAAKPGYRYIDTDPDNPFWLIHTDRDRDGFYFSLEMYTTGYGEKWTGETGRVAIACSEAPPGPESTGVCPHLDPDGRGPEADVVGFGGTGSINIRRLDDGGFDITIKKLSLPFGVTVTPFRLRGTAPKRPNG